MKKSVRVYLDHGEAYGNLGDEAMLISAVDRLGKYLGDCRFVIPIQDGMPLPNLDANVELVKPLRWIFRVTGRLVRVFFHLVTYIPYANSFVPLEKEEFDALVWRSVDRILNLLMPILLVLPNKVSKTISLLKTCDIFYGVGAASLNDYNLRDIVYRAWLYKAVKPWVKVSVVSSQGLGPFTIEWSRTKMKEALENLDILSFRDCHYSESIVEELQPCNVKYSIVGDEAFSLSVDDEEKSAKLLRESGLEDGRTFIAFHFRTTDYTKDTNFLVPKVAALLDELCKNVPHFLVFFPMSYHTHSRYDEQCGKAIKESMLQPDRLLLAPLCKDPRTVKGAIGKAVYSLGLSYHVHVFALSQDKPAIILYTGEYYKYKAEGLIGFYGEPCNALDLEQTSAEEFLGAIQELEDSYEATLKNIATVNEYIRDINDWHLREMKSMIKSSV